MRVVVSLILAAACGSGPTIPPRDTASFDAYELLVVEAETGRIEVVAGDVDTIEVEVLPGDTNDTWSSSEDGDTLTLIAECSGGEPGCGVGFVVTVPAGTHLDLSAVNGEIAVVDALTGDIAIQTTSGPIIGVDLGAAALDVLTNAVVDVSFDERPRDVSLDGGAGDLTLAVPAGSYDVQFAGSGDSELSDDIVDDDTSERLYLQSSAQMTIEAS
jgi:hypothetical protein